jgi:hypothetical protein
MRHLYWALSAARQAPGGQWRRHSQMGMDFPLAEGVPISLPEMLSTRPRSASWDRCRSDALARAKLFPSLGR